MDVEEIRKLARNKIEAEVLTKQVNKNNDLGKTKSPRGFQGDIQTTDFTV